MSIGKIITKKKQTSYMVIWEQGSYVPPKESKLRERTLAGEMNHYLQKQKTIPGPSYFGVTAPAPVFSDLRAAFEYAQRVLCHELYKGIILKMDGNTEEISEILDQDGDNIHRSIIETIPVTDINRYLKSPKQYLLTFTLNEKYLPDRKARHFVTTALGALIEDVIDSHLETLIDILKEDPSLDRKKYTNFLKQLMYENTRSLFADDSGRQDTPANTWVFPKKIATTLHPLVDLARKGISMEYTPHKLREGPLYFTEDEHKLVAILLAQKLSNAIKKIKPPVSYSLDPELTARLDGKDAPFRKYHI